MGGRLVSFHYSFGDYDGVIMLETPDEKAAASMVLAAVSAGHIKSIKTLTLLSVEDVMEVFRRVREMPGAIDRVMGVIGAPPITQRAYARLMMAP